MLKKNILPKYKEMPISYYPNCRVQALCTLLNLCGQAVTNEEVLLLSMSNFFSFGILSEYHKVNYGLLFSQTNQFEVKILSAFNVGFRYFENKSITFDEIKERIDEGGTPLLMFLDSYYLLGKKLYDQPTIAPVSTALVVGYDGNNVLLNSMADNKRFQSFSFEDFYKSCSCRLIPYSAKQSGIEVIDQNIKADVSGLIYSNLQQVSERFFEEEDPYQEKVDCGILTHYLNNKGLNMFYQYITEVAVKAKYLEPEYRHKVLDVILAALRKGIVSGTSTFMRKELGNALIYYSSLHDRNGKIGNAGNKYLELSLKWRKLSRGLSALSTKNMQDFFSSVSELVIEIIDGEQRAAKDIYDATHNT